MHQTAVNHSLWQYYHFTNNHRTLRVHLSRRLALKCLQIRLQCCLYIALTSALFAYHYVPYIGEAHNTLFSTAMTITLFFCTRSHVICTFYKKLVPWFRWNLFLCSIHAFKIIGYFKLVYAFYKHNGGHSRLAIVRFWMSFLITVICIILWLKDIFSFWLLLYLNYIPTHIALQFSCICLIVTFATEPRYSFYSFQSLGGGGARPLGELWSTWWGSALVVWLFCLSIIDTNFVSFIWFIITLYYCIQEWINNWGLQTCFIADQGEA